MLNQLVNFGLLGLLATFSLTNSAIAQQHQHSADAPTSITNTMPQEMGDQRFITMMIHYQQMSLQMASKAAENANVPQIRDLAQAIIKTQTAQIQQ